MKNWILWAMVSLIVVGLVHCGAGGGGGGGTGGGGISYNGVTTQAPITVANANKIFSVVWNGGPSSASLSSISGLASLSPAVSKATSYRGTVSLIKQLKDRMLSDFTGFAARSRNIMPAAAVNETDYGSVSGTLTITGDIDPYTMIGNLNMTYANYNNGDGYTHDGTVTFKVDGFDMSSGMITDGTMSFTLWTINSTSSNVSLSGSIRVQESLQNNGVTMSVNMDGRDNIANDTFRFQNFVITMNYNNMLSPNSETSIFSGRVFVGAYGYVDVSTTSPFVCSSYPQENPDSGGPIILIGAGNSKAAVTPISTNYVKIEVDADGDAVFESQNNYEWGNLTSISCTAPDGSTITITPSSQPIDTGGAGLSVPTSLDWTVRVSYPDGTVMPKACITVSGAFAVPNGFGLYQFEFFPSSVTPNTAVNSGFSAQTDDFGQYTFSTLLSAGTGTWNDTIYIRSGANQANATLSVK